MRLFRRDVEIALKTLGAIGLLTLVVLPVAWGYEERQKARTWQNIACAYRLRDIERRAPLFARLSQAPDACGTLRRLGLELDMPR
jgi:hypothetical protein